MNKKAILGLMLAALLPLACYWIMSRFVGDAVDMPRHYLADSVVTTVKDGKQVSDTAWHRLSVFPLINHMGDTVSIRDLEGKVIVADFFFTRCPTICPAMTMNMRRLQQSITNAQRVGDKTPDFIHYLSFSIDPERDSVPRLKAWADRFQVNPGQWWLLTGDRKKIYDLAINEMKLGVEYGQQVDTNFFHSDYFVLLDGHRQVRGYYHGLDTTDLAKLSRDIIYLSQEKQAAGSNIFTGQLPLIATTFLAAVVGVFLLLFFIRKKNDHVTTSLEKE